MGSKLDRIVRPLLTVVIPCLNAEEYIEDCLRSVARSASPEVEFRLIDGGSTDATLSIVGRYSDFLVEVQSERDKGQSHALNKGFRNAKGEYLTWLNADDVLCPGALAEILRWIKNNGAEWIAANMVLIDSTGRITRCCRGGDFETSAVRFGILNVFGPSTIFKRSLFYEVGEFREDFHYCMDTEYWWRMVSQGYRFTRAPIYLWGLRLHSQAKTAVGREPGGKIPAKMQAERDFYRSYFPKGLPGWAARIGPTWVRVQRILNLSYVFSALDTIRYRREMVLEMGVDDCYGWMRESSNP